MNILDLPAVNDIRTISQEIFAKGWGEANGGNISIRLLAEELAPCSDQLKRGQVLPEVKLPYVTPSLAGQYFLVTGTGVFFRHVKDHPEESLGIVQLNEKGDGYRLVWGYTEGGQPTSELAAHLLSHETRNQSSDGRNRTILHIHANHLIALTFVLPLQTAVITRELWEMMSECLLLFPEGIGVLDWMVPGQAELGYATAALMKQHRLVLWAHHGILAAAENLDQAFGLIETADKAAEMLLAVLAAGGKRQTVSAGQLRQLAQTNHLDPLAEALYEEKTYL